VPRTVAPRGAITNTRIGAFAGGLNVLGTRPVWATLMSQSAEQKPKTDPANANRLSWRIVTGLAAAGLSGLLLAMALPLGEQFYLAWIMLWPLLRVTRGAGLLWGVVLALVTIFVAAGIAETGLVCTIRSTGGNPAWIYTTFGTYGFCLALAVGIWADRGSASMRSWWFAALGVLLEAVLLLRIPAHLALTQYRQGSMLWLAGLGGIWLVSYLVWWSNFALASMKLRTCALWATVIVALSLAGSRFDFSSHGHLVRFGIVQIEEPDEEVMSRAQAQTSAQGAVITVWPEFGGMPFVGARSAGKLAALSAGKDSSSLVTSFEDDYRPLPHNASALFRKGRESALYFKRQLFGGEANMHAPGTRPAAADYDDGRAGLNICFDSCYPSIVRDTARLSGVNVICLPSTDPVVPNNFVAGMHAAYTPFRAAEEGVAFVKADGAAYSVFVDPCGHIVAELPPGDLTAVADVSVASRNTLYKRCGDWFLWLLGALVIALPLEIRRRKSPREAL
jgi:apolipoprotein N-acyltransferase